MTQYVGCDYARELLDGLIDGELSMPEQLAVESHLRWCRTCQLRVEDMSLIGASLRQGAPAHGADRYVDQAVSAINDAVLWRVRAERDQSWSVWTREMFADMRLFWPALGATAAVVLCVAVVTQVLHASSVQAQRPESLAAMITSLSNPAPLRPADNGFFGISIPRPNEADAERTGGTLDALPEEDLIYTVRTVVDREGRVSNLEILLAGGENSRGRSAAHAGRERAVLDAIAQTRFAVAQTALGQPVSVDMVWMIAKTTAIAGPELPAVVVPKTVVKDVPKPEVEEPLSTDNPLSSMQRPFRRYFRSTTA